MPPAHENLPAEPDHSPDTRRPRPKITRRFILLLTAMAVAAILTLLARCYGAINVMLALELALTAGVIVTELRPPR
jgi:hypothetical protein